ncbi:unnamed protein product, partial [Bubo scandiacus]
VSKIINHYVLSKGKTLIMQDFIFFFLRMVFVMCHSSLIKVEDIFKAKDTWK